MKKFILVFMLFFLITPSEAIVDNKKIDLNEAIEITLYANPRVKIESLNVKTSENNVKVAGQFLNPSIYTMQNMGKTGEGEPQQVGASYIFEVLKRGKRQDYAKSQAIVALYNQKQQEQLLILNVKKAYLDLLLKKTKYKVLLEQKVLSEEILESAKEEASKGHLVQTDVVQAKIALNRSIMYANTAKSEVIFSQNHFNSVMNTSEFNYDTKEEFLTDDYSKLYAISPVERDINFSKIKEYALSNRYDLLKARQEVESARAKLLLVKSNLIPDVELSGGYSYQTAHVSPNGKSLSGAFAGLNLINLPLFHQYRPEIENAQLEIQKAELTLEDITNDVIRDLTDAWEKFIIARDNLNFYNKELLSNSRELLKESKESLKKQEIDLTTFLVSKKLYLELILGYEDALSEYYISYAELLKEVNSNSIDLLSLDNI